VMNHMTSGGGGGEVRTVVDRRGIEHPHVSTFAKPGQGKLTEEPKPLPIRNGILHLHWVPTGKGGFAWIVRTRMVEGICGGYRCIRLEVNTDVFRVPCDHDWKPPAFGLLRCDRCGEWRQFDIDLSEAE
jgi:hypothetical protein